ncbi:TonB-dependent receptor plug domain-containing protein [Enterovibrio sp. ZSDZ42]|uniref:TonB-dependent receptor plug domain-containing protein n=1 Tax=Enterovibrio gelatinilyticus TaxID=2899819 RepID=A0ABT5R078_9GAMM|nr:TonB-dependent receptor plug domain-containing protein [Enterovibrio sp. ZSDZ42]MDD1793659.1 TonB-dependent receptor plug domain-containing protein [Enterovibrio sp. ZSDZ42]
MLKARLAVSTACLSLLISSPVIADDELAALLDMPLESLSDTKVVSATRTALSLSDVPAAVHVITAKEIKRSGARSVADVLVLAPGLHVAKYSNYDWGIAARSPNETLSNTMLVMVDGRSVFNGMFSGVDWDLIPVSLDSIERIEVVMGPVGTIWGGNAVNAVVNVITYDAEDAPRNKVSASIGNYHYKEARVHHGGQVTNNLYMSGYAELVEHMPWTSDEDRVQPIQHFRVQTERFGVRGDYQKNDREVSFQLGGIRSREDYNWGSYQPHFLTPGVDGPDYVKYETEMLAEEYFAGVKFLQELGGSKQWEQQFWLTYSSSDGSDRNAYFTRIDSETRYSDNNVLGGQLTVGFDYRVIDEYFRPYEPSEIYTSPYVRVADEAGFVNQSAAAYFNYTYPLTDTTSLMVGNRWQYFNMVSETFSQPQVRVMQEVGDNQRVWAGWGRAVVTPARQGRSTDFHENGYQSNYFGNYCYVDESDAYQCLESVDYLQIVEYLGNEDLPVQTVDTYELGYRLWEGNVFQFDANLFYSEEDGIPAWMQISGVHLPPIIGNSSPDADGTVIGLFQYQHIAPLSSQTYGGELSMKWQPTSAVQVNASYSYREIKADCHGAICSSTDVPMRSYENEPVHLANAQIMWDITPQWWVSNVVNYVHASSPDDVLQDVEYYAWPEVLTWDMVIGWQASEHMPLVTLSAESLFNDQVNEYPESYAGFNNGTQYWLEVDWQWK